MKFDGNRCPCKAWADRQTAFRRVFTAAKCLPASCCGIALALLTLLLTSIGARLANPLTPLLPLTLMRKRSPSGGHGAASSPFYSCFDARV